MHVAAHPDVRVQGAEGRPHRARGIGCPMELDFGLFDQSPLTDADGAATERVQPVGRQSASEDFRDIPTPPGAPCTYWFVGGTHADSYDRALRAGRPPGTSRSTTRRPSRRSST